jgi:hypothetical protein
MKLIDTAKDTSYQTDRHPPGQEAVVAQQNEHGGLIDYGFETEDGPASLVPK